MPNASLNALQAQHIAYARDVLACDTDSKDKYSFFPSNHIGLLYVPTVIFPSNKTRIIIFPMRFSKLIKIITINIITRLQTHCRCRNADVLHRNRFRVYRFHFRHDTRVRGQRKNHRSELLRSRDISFSFSNEHGEKSVGDHADFRSRKYLPFCRRNYRDRLRVKRRDWRYVDHVRTRRTSISQIYWHGVLQHVLAGSGEPFYSNFIALKINFLLL